MPNELCDECRTAPCLCEPVEPTIDAGPQGVCWEYQAGELPIRLSFSVKVF